MRSACSVLKEKLFEEHLLERARSVWESGETGSGASPVMKFVIRSVET
jgi:hypothetical protein